MRVRCLTMGFACISCLALGLAPTQASAQLFGSSPFQRPAVNPQAAPNPAQPVPAATRPQGPAGSNSPTAVTPPLAAGSRQVSGEPERAQPGRQGRIMRGSQLIGLNIRGSDDHQLGTVKDFIVDYQAECPMIYFAVEPDASLQLGEEYVILPYSAMQYRYDRRGERDYFALDVSGMQLRNAPHVAVNDWSAFNDRQVLSNAHQFYQRTERTTARPIEGGPAKQNEQGTRPETGTRPDASTHRNDTPRPESAPGLDTNTQPRTTPRPESAPRPGANTQPETAPAPVSKTHPAAATRPESGERPATGTRPESKVK